MVDSIVCKQERILDVELDDKSPIAEVKVNGTRYMKVDEQDQMLDLLEETVKEKLSPGLIGRVNEMLNRHHRSVRLCREYGHGGGFCGAPDCWLRDC